MSTNIEWSYYNSDSGVKIGKWRLMLRDKQHEEHWNAMIEHTCSNGRTFLVNGILPRCSDCSVGAPDEMVALWKLLCADSLSIYESSGYNYE